MQANIRVMTQADSDVRAHFHPLSERDPPLDQACLLTIDDALNMMPLISAPFLGYHHAITISTQNFYLIPLVLCPRVRCLRDVRPVDSILSGATESSPLSLHSSAIYAHAYRALPQTSQAWRVICQCGCGPFNGWWRLTSHPNI